MTLLDEETERCAADARRATEQANIANALSRVIADLMRRNQTPRWLERDYDDEREGDWTR